MDGGVATLSRGRSADEPGSRRGLSPMDPNAPHTKHLLRKKKNQKRLRVRWCPDRDSLQCFDPSCRYVRRTGHRGACDRKNSAPSELWALVEPAPRAFAVLPGVLWGVSSCDQCPYFPPCRSRGLVVIPCTVVDSIPARDEGRGVPLIRVPSPWHRSNVRRLVLHPVVFAPSLHSASLPSRASLTFAPRPDSPSLRFFAVLFFFRLPLRLSSPNPPNALPLSPVLHAHPLFLPPSLSFPRDRPPPSTPLPHSWRFPRVLSVSARRACMCGLALAWALARSTRRRVWAGVRTANSPLWALVSPSRMLPLLAGHQRPRVSASRRRALQQGACAPRTRLAASHCHVFRRCRLKVLLLVVVVVVVVVLRNKNPPTPCLWQAPASTQKPKGKPGRPFFGAHGGGP